MRTYALVSLGAALFTIIAGMVSFQYASSFVFDPTRVLSQIVVGVGFLGGGMIFVSKKDVVNGLTTAAGIWVTAAIGAACGYGLYAIATFVTFLVLTIFEVLWYVEERFIKTARTDAEEDALQGKAHEAEHNEDEN
jgi:putative Mg2+ transporter-C (MgtC) family protein